MQLAIIHLSDIHFRTTSNPTISRLEPFVGALRPSTASVDGLIIAVTGDIAFSGSKAEYEVAFQYFNQLRDRLATIVRDIPIVFVFIPGNHDCDFSSADEVRPALLETLNKKISTIAPKGTLVQQILRVQDSFFSFEARFHKDNQEVPVADRLRYQVSIKIGERRVLFDCYNTAWMSQKDEQQGKLLFPTQVLQPEPPMLHDPEPDLRISLLHHRDNWLEANNARILREYVETYSDLILSGHEHVSAAYRKEKLEGAAAQYIEGAVLQDATNPGDSGFNVIQFDFGNGLQNISRFRWSGARYNNETPEYWTRFQSNNGRTFLGRFQIKQSFQQVLHDPGTGFFHPDKPDLALEDFYVYPDFRRMSLTQLIEKKSPAKSVRGEEFVGFVAQSKHVVVSGTDESGRTALARMLYLDLRHQQKLVAVMLNGKDIHGKNPEAGLRRALTDAVQDQYSGNSVKAYADLEPARKVLIIDDWHKLRYNTNGELRVLTTAETLFDTIICFVDDAFLLGQFAEQTDHPFNDYEICEIRELGHLRRSELIRKWLSLGRDYSLQSQDLVRALATMESVVNTLLGKNLLPAYPLVVLVILQTYEASRTSNTSAGSYGQMYEVLITTALASVSKKAVDLGTKYTYLSRIAYHIFTTHNHALDRAELTNIYDEYHAQYQITFDSAQMLEELATAQIICHSNGTWHFKYKYIYCYFVAKYFQDNIANLENAIPLKQQLRDLADQVYFEDYTNIIIFYVYLTKDRELIEYLLSNAKKIYKEHEPCNLDSHVEFVNRLSTATAELVLPSTDCSRNRDEALRRKDEEDDVAPRDDEGAADVKYADSLPDLVKVHIALRSIRILGQILRNFPGALKADLKCELARDNYQLGLRTLRAVLLILENDIVGFRNCLRRDLRPPNNSLKAQSPPPLTSMR